MDDSADFLKWTGHRRVYWDLVETEWKHSWSWDHGVKGISKWLSLMTHHVWWSRHNKYNFLILLLFIKCSTFLFDWYIDFSFGEFRFFFGWKLFCFFLHFFNFSLFIMFYKSQDIMLFPYIDACILLKKLLTFCYLNILQYLKYYCKHRFFWFFFIWTWV